MREWQSQSHVRWYCKYHVVFVPKYRKRSLYGTLQHWGIAQGIMPPAWSGACGGSRDAGSHPLVSEHSTQVQRGQYGGVSLG